MRASHRLAVCGLSAILALAVPLLSSAQPNLLHVIGPSPTLRVRYSSSIEDMEPAVNASSHMFWMRHTTTTKITAQTDAPSQAFSLSVEAVDVSGGLSAGEVELVHGMPSLDLIVDIPPWWWEDPGRSGRRADDLLAHAGGGYEPGQNQGGFGPIEWCTLRYTASATFEQGHSGEEGVDVHTVTYTLVAQ